MFVQAEEAKFSNNGNATTHAGARADPPTAHTGMQDAATTPGTA